MSVQVAGQRFLSAFSCLGDRCEDTCCKGWGMQVDDATFTQWQSTAPDLIGCVTGEAGTRVMKRDAQSDCCVKLEGGLCGIQNTRGAMALSDACYSYPRISRLLGKQQVMTGALSCPEITRLVLESDEALTPADLTLERVPLSFHDYLPESLSEVQALSIHHAFLAEALNAARSPQRSVIRLFCVAQSLENIPLPGWPDALPFYLEHAESRLSAPQPSPTDPFFLLQSLCGLVAAAKKGHQPRLMQVIDDMQQALHITIRWDNLSIAALPDSMHAAGIMQNRWNTEWAVHYAPVLRRYLAAQLSLALFPFAGFGDTLPNRMGIIGIRFALMQLALMSACSVKGGLIDRPEVVRIIQSLSRFLDHLSEPEFSLKIYQETGWLAAPRLRALLGDA